MPRGLYGRAALIILVPVLAIQLVVMVAFSQRYFDDITRQFMAGVNAEIGLYVTAMQTLPPPEAAAERAVYDAQLGIESRVGVAAQQVETARPWFDVTSRIIERELRQAYPGLEGIDVARDTKRVFLSFLLGEERLELVIPRRRASASNPHQLLVWTAFTGVVMTLVAIIFLRNQLRPIRQLARAAEAFGRGENLPYRLRGASEVRAAGASFLSMRARIERQIEQRTLMLSGVSHDLRTPLTRVRLGLSMLEAEAESAAAQDEVAAMRQDLNEMEQLIDAFLAFARSDRTEEPTSLDLTALLTRITTQAERQGGEVRFGAMPDDDVPVVVKARPIALERALGNLVSNALRYGAQAQISLRVYDKAVVISVEDDGPGIPEQDRERAMQPFVRLDGARNQDLGSGVGLGLAIAFDTARRHGGTLRLSQSEALGGLKAELVLSK